MRDKDYIDMVEIKKETIRFSKRNWNDISLLYNIRCNLNIDDGKVDVRRIQSVCITCIEQFELSWDDNQENYNQSRYGVIKDCFL